MLVNRSASSLATSETTFEVHEVVAERLAHFERLFEARGGPKFCWCMAWRTKSVDAKGANSALKKAAMVARIESGTPVGLLGYLGEEPVAWCSIAPRTTYRRLVSDGSPDEGIWSIVCFFVLKPYRQMGITKRMLAAALTHAYRRGAQVVEAYPVLKDSPSYRFMGFVPMFEEAGFKEIGREGSRRHVMQCKAPTPKHVAF
jgi:GNAT superfamily N-acetyltransferase